MLPSITTIYGEPGTIKTSLAITWPGPIAFYNLQGGGTRACVEMEDGTLKSYTDLVADGSIIERTFHLPHRSLTERWEKLAGYKEAWTALTVQMEKDLKDFATVAWDTGTVIWALDRDSFLQDIQKEHPTRKQLQQIEYGTPNRQISELFNLNRGFQRNLVITHDQTDEYAHVMDPMGRPVLDENGIPVSYTTGRKVPEGFKHTLALSDWVLHTELRDNIPWMTVEKSGYGLTMRGKEIEWPTFDKLDTLVTETMAPAKEEPSGC